MAPTGCALQCFSGPVLPCRFKQSISVTRWFPNKVCAADQCSSRFRSIRQARLHLHATGNDIRNESTIEQTHERRLNRKHQALTGAVDEQQSSQLTESSVAKPIATNGEVTGGNTSLTEFPEQVESTSGSLWSRQRLSNSYSKTHYEVLRLDAHGKTRKLSVRRRDLLKEYMLQPRDLRRVDPIVDVNKTSPSITIKENVLLLCLGGVRAIVTADKALLFEPSAPATRRFLDTLTPHLKARSDARASSEVAGGSSSVPSSSDKAAVNASHEDYMAHFYAHKDQSGAAKTQPFELAVLEAALMVATGCLDMEMLGVTQRVQQLVEHLPNDINPVSLDELRRVKTALVELESKANTLRTMVEELMDDEDELRELNLSTRPRREERRRYRERGRLERELQRAHETQEASPNQAMHGDHSGSPQQHMGSGPLSCPGPSTQTSFPDPSHDQTPNTEPHDQGSSSWAAGSEEGADHSITSQAHLPPVQLSLAARDSTQERLDALRVQVDSARLAELRSKFSWGGAQVENHDEGGGGRQHWQEGRWHGPPSHRGQASQGSTYSGGGGHMEGLWVPQEGGAAQGGGEGWDSHMGHTYDEAHEDDEDIHEVQDSLEEMVEQEEEEQEVDEVEDLLEHYLQRASAAQAEAEHLLSAGARDLEESIGVSLSARRYEVNRLELTLSIASFASAVGAMVAGIFGMNMRSMLEMSVASFWGVTGAIVVGCALVFGAIMRYTQAKRIL